MATQVIDDGDIETPPDSEVERIVQRLELRNDNRVSVPLEVKKSFLRLCNEASILRNTCKNRNEGNDNDTIIPVGDSTTISKPAWQPPPSTYSPCLLRTDNDYSDDDSDGSDTGINDDNGN